MRADASAVARHLHTPALISAAVALSRRRFVVSSISRCFSWVLFRLFACLCVCARPDVSGAEAGRHVIEQAFLYTHTHFSLAYNGKQLIQANLTYSNPQPIVAGTRARTLGRKEPPHVLFTQSRVRARTGSTRLVPVRAGELKLACSLVCFFSCVVFCFVVPCRAVSCPAAAVVAVPRLSSPCRGGRRRAAAVVAGSLVGGCLPCSGLVLPMTYSVRWVRTSESFARRFDRYLDFDFFEHHVHWLSIFNSFMLVRRWRARSLARRRALRTCMRVYA